VICGRLDPSEVNEQIWIAQLNLELPSNQGLPRTVDNYFDLEAGKGQL